MFYFAIYETKYGVPRTYREASSARDDLVVVMNRDQPDAVIVGLQSGKLLSEPGARVALATALFRDGGLSLVQCCTLSGT